MPVRPPKYCRECGKSEAEVGPISWRGLCEADGERREVENMRQLRAHSGPWFDHWRRRSAAGLGIFLPPPQPEPELDASERAA